MSRVRVTGSVVPVVFTTGQMKRTIKGAEKVPRTVANEPTYWNAYMQRQFGQSSTIVGGGDILLATVVLALVGATVGTDRYRPVYWTAPIGLYVTGALFVALGVHLQKDADRKMEAIKAQKDPLRWGFSQRPRVRVAPPSFSFGPGVDGRGFDARLGWSFRF